MQRCCIIFADGDYHCLATPQDRYLNFAKPGFGIVTEGSFCAIADYSTISDYSISEYEGTQLVHEETCLIHRYPVLAGELLSHFDGNIKDA